MIYDSRRDMHDSLDVVLRYAMPNVNARYTADRIGATRWEGDYPVCAVCGTSRRPFEVHHEPPRSDGSLLLNTKMGHFVVKPALLLLCKRCHQGRHGGRLDIGWEFDCEAERERFLSGWFFAHGYAEHDRRFFRHGRIVAGRRSPVTGEFLEVFREVREDVWDGLPTIAELEAEAAGMREAGEMLDAAYERIGWTGGRG